MNESNPPFPPFNPAPPMYPQQPADVTTEIKSETAKQKAAREKREAKATAKANVPGMINQPRQRRKSPNGTKTAPKFELQTILAAASTLNADDYPLFEKVINLLDEAGKPGRERLMAAITKVFA